MGQIALESVTKVFGRGVIAVNDAASKSATKARVGDRIQLALDPSRLYFFAPETGESLLGHAVAA